MIVQEADVVIRPIFFRFDIGIRRQDVKPSRFHDYMRECFLRDFEAIDYAAFVMDLHRNTLYFVFGGLVNDNYDSAGLKRPYPT